MIVSTAKLRALVLSIAAPFVLPSMAAQAGPKLGQEEHKQIIVESVNLYKEISYSTSNELRLEDNLDALGWTGPELVLGKRIQAMLRSDYAGALATWSKVDQEDLIRRDRAEGRTAQFWQQYWAKGFSGSSGRLVKRVERGDFIFLKYELVRDGKTVFDSSVAFYKDGEVWVGTNRLKGDPVYMHWESGKKRVQAVASPPKLGAN